MKNIDIAKEVLMEFEEFGNEVITLDESVGFIQFEGYNDGEYNIEIGQPVYTASWERSARLYLQKEYKYTEDQANAFLTWYCKEIEGPGLEVDMVETPFAEEVLWFLEYWNQDQIEEIGKGIINIHNVDAQREPYRTKPDYCNSER